MSRVLVCYTYAVSYRPLPAWKLAVYSLLPSWTSLIGVAAGALLFIGLHLLWLSVIAGTAFADIWDGALSIAYTNYVVRFLLYISNLSAFGLILNLLCWGLLGWLVFSLGEILARRIREWHQVEESVMINGQQVVRHPLRENFIIRILWQLACIIVFGPLIIAAIPVIKHVMELDSQMFAGQSLNQTLINLLIAVAWLSLLEHCIIVLLRLFSFRTRLTDNPHYQ